MGEMHWSAGKPRHRRAMGRIFLGLAIQAGLAAGIITASDAKAVESTTSKTIIGRTEKVWIAEAGIVLDAKIDTGTLTTSLNARDIQIFAKNGEEWTRFVVESPDGKSIALERQVVRIARFKKQNHEVERRPIIYLGLCISDVYRRAEVNLTNRERFTYPVLIGRRFMSGKLIIDPEKKFTRPPQCKEMDKKG